MALVQEALDFCDFEGGVSCFYLEDIHIHTYIHIHIQIYIYIYVCTHIHIHIHIDMYTYTHIHIYTYTYIYIYTYCDGGFLENLGVQSLLLFFTTLPWCPDHPGEPRGRRGAGEAVHELGALPGNTG